MFIKARLKQSKPGLKPMTVTEVMSFHGLASVYGRFIRDFNSVMTPIRSKCMKKRAFKCSEATQKAFEEIKHKLY